MPPFRPDPLNMFTNMYAEMPMNKDLGLGESSLGESGVGPEEGQIASSIGQGAGQLLHPIMNPCEATLASIGSGSSTWDDKTLNGEHMWWNAGNKGDIAERLDITDDSTTFFGSVEQHSTSHSGDIFDTSDLFPVDLSFGLSIRTSCSGIGPESPAEFIQ
jgi:hypothetical protein